MSRQVSRAASISLTGVEGTVVMVEAAVTNQLPGMAIIGLPDTAVAEAKQRVRLATQQAGLELTDRFLLVNLSPAALPKQGSSFDLAIALAALAASGRLAVDRLDAVAHLGELGLDGGLRRPLGLLSAVLAAQRLGFERVMVPAAAAREAALVPGVEVIAVDGLRGAVSWYLGEAEGWRIAEPASAEAPIEPSAAAVPITVGSDGILRATGESAEREPDISEIVGQPEAVEVLAIAAAGRHHLSMIGPPGAGKTLLATRLPTILPDLSPEESITASSIASLDGATLTSLVRRPPFVSPHHTASHAAIIGGGNGVVIRPGAITRAAHGVLFLDEAPEFSRDVLDSLRQPLESGVVEIHRARVHATLPARVQLVLAANPCPCGNAGVVDALEPCRCSPSTRVRYLGRISGPLNDRIDLRLTIRRVSSVLEGVNDEPGPSSREMRRLVVDARERAAERLRGTPWRVNGEVSGPWLRSPAMRLPRADTAVLDRALARGALSVRGYDRTLRLGWTIADLAGKDRPGRAELARALMLRGGAGS